MSTFQLSQAVAEIFKTSWVTREGQKVPEPPDLRLSNDGVKLEGTVLYADLSASTKLVDEYDAEFAAEIYKSYLHCAASIIKSKGGVITAYDGDRIMAVYIGGSKNSSAAITALNIHHAVLHIINPAIKTQYPNRNYEVRQVVGIDTSQLMAARTGVRGNNDLVWVGRAANHAAKLTSPPTLYSAYSSFITSDVYNCMSNEAKYWEDGTNMWTPVWRPDMNTTVYGSSWWWNPDYVRA